MHKYNIQHLCNLYKQSFNRKRYTINIFYNTSVEVLYISHKQQQTSLSKIPKNPFFDVFFIKKFVEVFLLFNYFCHIIGNRNLKMHRITCNRMNKIKHTAMKSRSSRSHICAAIHIIPAQRCAY